MSLSLCLVRGRWSEAAKFGVNASLALVRPVGIDFEEDARGHDAGGTQGARYGLIDRQHGALAAFLRPPLREHTC